MKTVQMLKLAAFGMLLFTASFLACTDHTLPDPTSNCQLLDGTQRFYPCEFEVVKAEFCKQLDINDVFGTVTSENPGIVLPMQYAWFNFSFVPNTINLTYKVKLHVKRIANPSVKPSENYILDKPTGNPAQIVSAYQVPFFPPIHPQVATDLLALPLGEAAIIISDAEYHIEIKYLPPLNTPDYSVFSGNVLYAVHNVATTKSLIAAPHNYILGVDAAEAHMLIKPAFEN